MPIANARGKLDRCSHLVDLSDSRDISFKIVAVKLDLEMGETVRYNPFVQALGKAVIEPLINLGGFDRITGAHRMVAPEPRLGSAQDILARKPAFEPRPQIARQVVSHELRTIGEIAIQQLNLPECVVGGGIDRACCNQSAQLWNRLVQMHLAGHFVSSPQILGTKQEVDLY